MTQQEKIICPACGEALKVGLKFCTNCGVKLSEFNEIETISEAPPPVQTMDHSGRDLLLKGWEISSDRVDKFNKMMYRYPIGQPIITSKCVLDSYNGFLVVSNNGIAWRYKITFGTAQYEPRFSSLWIRWHDVANIIPKKKGQVLVVMKKRRKGLLKLDRKGNYKLRKLKFTIRQNKHEQKPRFRQRLESFTNIMLEIFNRYRVELDPQLSDSQIK